MYIKSSQLSHTSQTSVLKCYINNVLVLSLSSTTKSNKVVEIPDQLTHSSFQFATSGTVLQHSTIIMLQQCYAQCFPIRVCLGFLCINAFAFHWLVKLAYSCKPVMEIASSTSAPVTLTLYFYFIVIRYCLTNPLCYTYLICFILTVYFWYTCLFYSKYKSNTLYYLCTV